MANEPKLPSKEILEVIDKHIEYLPISGKLFWNCKRNIKATRIKIGIPLTTLDKHGYLVIKLNKKSIKLHHLAFYKFYGRWPLLEIDHKDRNKSNNSILNIREAGRNKNRWNIPVFKNNHLGEKGIRKLKNRFTFRAIRGNVKITKYFKTIEEATNFREFFYKEYEEW